MTIEAIGWDLGGAHLKAVALNAKGQILRAEQRACPLWQGLDRLTAALDSIAATFPIAEARVHAVTMTGELADLFPSRREGVLSLAGAMRERIDARLLFFAGPAGLLDAASIGDEHCDLIASANWLASGRWAAEHCANGLLIDIGSTTIDLILLMNGQVLTRGYADCERLRYDELVYHGIVRTPVMTIADSAPFDGHWLALMNEQFATAADVYRLTGELPEHADQFPAADGATRDHEGSARRLARMIGRDRESAAMEQWTGLARYFRECQLARLSRAAQLQLSRVAHPDETCLIGAGVGRFLVQELSHRLGFPYRDAQDWLETAPEGGVFSAADCMPAAAVAYLGIAAS